MNILDFALKMERDGEEFYRRLAADSSPAGLRAIFGLLADAEARHWLIVADMKAQRPTELGETPVLDQAKTLFEQLQDKTPADLADPNATDPQVQLYREAKDIERRSMEFYAEKAAEVENAEHASVLLRLAEEEKRHYWIMHNLVEHVGRPDHGWIEFAEWNHMEPY